MPNPFQYGLAVDAKSFCNRQQELSELRSAITSGQRIFVYGERRLGKTSLVRLLLSKLPQTQYITAYVDLWATDREADFIEVYARALTQAASSTPQKMLEFARNMFVKLVPTLTVDDEGKPQVNFDFSRRPRDIRPTLESVIDSPELIAKKFKKKMVVVFDEFQQLLEYEEDLVERMLRSAIQFQPNVSYIFLGSRKHFIKKMVQDRSRPFYKAGPHFSLGSIATKHWLEFITERFAIANKRISNDHIEKLCALTEGHPFYTQHLCHALWELTEEDGDVSDENIAAALNQVLAHEDYAYSMIWESLSATQRKVLEGIALEGADAQIYSSDFLQEYDIKVAATAQRAVKALTERELLDQESGRHFIVDRFFRLWIARKHD